MSRRWATLAALALLSLSAAVAPPAAAGPVIVGAGDPTAIPGSYLVVYHGAPRVDLATKYGVDVRHRYSAALHGFAGRMSEATARAIAADPAVGHVEQDRTVTTAATQSPVPSWGLDRIDQVALPLDNSYTYSTTAPDVTVFVIDTGIRLTHNDFGGRAVWGVNTTGDGINTDCHGHGTHVSGTIGGTVYGVAKGVRLVAVKVLTCSGSGTFAGVVAGIDWVTQHHGPGPAVANLSFAGPASTIVDNAVRNAINHGVIVVVAAGNDGRNACGYSPGRVSQAITVGAADRNDVVPPWSNFGACLDRTAPGVTITSLWNTTDTATNTLSGTSIAAAHLSGLAAIDLSIARRPVAGAPL